MHDLARAGADCGCSSRSWRPRSRSRSSPDAGTCRPRSSSSSSAWSSPSPCPRSTCRPRMLVRPELLLAIVLPGLVFEAAFRTDLATIRPAVAGHPHARHPGRRRRRRDRRDPPVGDDRDQPGRVLPRRVDGRRDRSGRGPGDVPAPARARPAGDPRRDGEPRQRRDGDRPVRAGARPAGGPGDRWAALSCRSWSSWSAAPSSERPWAGRAVRLVGRRRRARGRADDHDRARLRDVSPRRRPSVGPA